MRCLSSPGCTPMRRVTAARRSLAVGAAVRVLVYRSCVEQAAGCGCAWCAWRLCRVCVFARVRGGAVCAVVPWCVVLPSFVRPTSAPPSLSALCCCCVPWCRGLWLGPLPCVRPSHLRVPCLAGAVPSFFFPRCGVFYPFLYSLLVGPPPWRVFFPPSLASLCVARLSPLPTSSFSWSCLSCVATAFHLHVPLLSALSW